MKMSAAGLDIGRASDVVAGGTSTHRPPGPGAVATRAAIHLIAVYFSDPASVAADPEPMSTLLMLADSPARSRFEARPPAAFSKLNTVAVFMEPLLPTPHAGRTTPPAVTGLTHGSSREMAFSLRRHEGISVSHNVIA